MLHVVFKVGDAEYVVAAESVLHMESFTGATHVPGAPAFVAGLVQIRQRVVPVVDLRLRFGLPPGEPGLGQRVIVVQVDERAVGLLVDSAREVLDVPADAVRSPPDLIAGQSQGFVRAVVAMKDRLLMSIDLARVVGPDTLPADVPGGPDAPDTHGADDTDDTDDTAVKEIAHAQ
jgi:purine-binding chemotaxis protein CheW